MTVTEQSGAVRTQHEPRKNRQLIKLIPLLLALAGIVLLLYPVVGTLLKNHSQTGQAQVYTNQITGEATQEEREKAIADAHAWNDEHQGMPILDPWLARVTKDNPDYDTYLKQLNITDAMGRIVIPSISSDLPIYHGTREDTLTRGIGHLYGSSLPVGGEGTHSILTGHTGLPGATMWDNLKELGTGDAVYMDVAGQKMKYEVSNIDVVLPDKTSTLEPVAGKDQITLITCTPYGVNSHRLLITAQRVPLDEDDNEVFSQIYSPWQWWMTAALSIVAVVILIIFLVWMSARKRRRKGDLADA